MSVPQSFSSARRERGQSPRSTENNQSKNHWSVSKSQKHYRVRSENPWSTKTTASSTSVASTEALGNKRPPQAFNFPASEKSRCVKILHSRDPDIPQTQQAVDTLKLIPDVTVKEYSIALAALRRLGQWEKAIKLLEEMWTRGVRPNVVSYTTVISACERGAQWEYALKLLKEMRERGIKPDLKAYSASISVCASSRRWEQAWSLLHDMHRDGIKADVVAYNATLSALEKGNQWEYAMKLFEFMTVEAKLRPDVITYTSLISACARAREGVKAVELLRTMQGFDRLRPNTLTYNAAMWACERSQMSSEALVLVQEMAKNKIEMDRNTYNTAIRCCCVEGRLDLCLAFKDEMVRLGFTPTTEVYQLTMNLAASARADPQVFDMLSFEHQRLYKSSLTPRDYCDRANADYFQYPMFYQQYAPVALLPQYVPPEDACLPYFDGPTETKRSSSRPMRKKRDREEDDSADHQSVKRTYVNKP